MKTKSKSKKQTKPAPRTMGSDFSQSAAKNKPEPQSLPGMEDRQITELHESAMEYAQIRDERMRLNGEEVDLKAKLLGLMKKHGKESYKYNGVEVNVVHEEETVKVRIKKKDEDEE